MFDIILNFIGALKKWWKKHIYTTGKTKVLIWGFGLICGFFLCLIFTAKFKDRLIFQVQQYCQIPGKQYGLYSTPHLSLSELGEDKKVNLKYNFTYSYTDEKEHDSKGLVHISCPSKYNPVVKSLNNIKNHLEPLFGDDGQTNFYFELTPRAKDSTGYIELQLQFQEPGDSERICIDGYAKDKFLFLYGPKYNAGKASYTLEITE